MAEIAFLLYEDMTALDAVGPYEVLARLPRADVKFVASDPGPITTDVGLVLVAGSRLEDVPAPDIVVVPGGPGTLKALGDTAAVEWLRQAHESSKWSLEKADAGTRRRATEHMVPGGRKVEVTR